MDQDRESTFRSCRRASKFLVCAELLATSSSKNTSRIRSCKLADKYTHLVDVKALPSQRHQLSPSGKLARHQNNHKSKSRHPEMYDTYLEASTLLQDEHDQMYCAALPPRNLCPQQQRQATRHNFQKSDVHLQHSGETSRAAWLPSCFWQQPPQPG